MRILLSFIFIVFVSKGYSQCQCNQADGGDVCRVTSIDSIIGDERKVRIAWKINDETPPPYCGKFVNGDIWLAPFDTGNTIIIDSVRADYFFPGDRVNQKDSFIEAEVFVDENPQLESNGFLGDENNYGSYERKENILFDTPFEVNGITSLVAGVKKDELQFGNCGTAAIVGSCIDLYQVLTILEEPPTDGGQYTLRPNIDETDKDLMSLDDFDLSHLPSLDYIEPLSAAQVSTITQRWSHSIENFSIKSTSGEVFSEGGRAFRADSLVDDYAAGTAQIFYNDFMSLLSSGDTLDEKIQAISAMITYGKDIYFAIYDGNLKIRSWGSGAGQHLGKFAPAVLFATLHRDNVFANNLKRSTFLTGSREIEAPQELEQINHSPNGPIWGDFPDVMTRGEINRYWAELFKAQCYDGANGLCDSNRGKKTTRDPYNIIDGPPTLPGTFYMNVSAGPMQGLAAMSHLMPKFCETVNSPFLTQYVDRIINWGVMTNNDTCAPPDPREDVEKCDPFRATGCEYYGLSHTGTPTWGPVSEQKLRSCISNNSGGNKGQNGRYLSRHNSKINIGFRSLLVSANWEKIIKEGAGCYLSDEIFHSGFDED